MPEPKLSLTVSTAAQNLCWAGLTNVVYNVQGVTSLLGSWTTLGRVANSATNFSFTNWNNGPQSNSTDWPSHDLARNHKKYPPDEGEGMTKPITDTCAFVGLLSPNDELLRTDREDFTVCPRNGRQVVPFTAPRTQSAQALALFPNPES